MPFKERQRVRMLVPCEGATAVDRDVSYPAGTQGLIDHVDERGAYHVVVGPPGDDSSIVVVIEAADVSTQIQAIEGRLTASVIPFSSIVGTGVLLQDETGAVVGQLSLLGAAWLDKTEQVPLCERIARAINAGQAERQVTHTKKGTTYDVVAGEALFQVSGSPVPGGLKPGRIVEDGDPVTVYRNREGIHFVRFPDEMVSPRFEEVSS